MLETFTVSLGAILGTLWFAFLFLACLLILGFLSSPRACKFWGTAFLALMLCLIHFHMNYRDLRSDVEIGLSEYFSDELVEDYSPKLEDMKLNLEEEVSRIRMSPSRVCEAELKFANGVIGVKNPKCFTDFEEGFDPEPSSGSTINLDERWAGE